MKTSRQARQALIAGLLASLVVLATGTQTPAQSGLDEGQDPQALYLRAWTLVSDSYFDRTFNKQDWSVWKHKYDGKLKTRQDAADAIKTMLASLNNSHTKLVEPGSAKKQDPNLFGIGLKLSKKADQDPTVIVEAAVGSAAQKMGVRSGDVLVAIDGKTVAGKSLDDIADLVRGPEHTKTTLTITRKGATKKITAERTDSHLEDLLCVRTLPGNIGYIRLDDMHNRDFVAVVKKELQKIDTTGGIILDLRNNSGGLLANSIELSQLFVPKGKIIMSVMDNAGYKTSQVQGKEPIYKGRLFVLIDHETAAGAEIIAAALKEAAGAQIVGTPSLGNATLDAINPLGGGVGVTLSIAAWVTPNGNSILNKGITPDAPVAVSAKEASTKGPWWLAEQLNEPGSPHCADVQLMKALSLAQAAAK